MNIKKSVPIAFLLGLCVLHRAAVADTTEPPTTEETWSIHGQTTNVTQWHSAFTSPYSGPNSLDAKNRSAETTDVTLFAGVRPWQGGELYLNPEFDQGFGLSRSVGVAGFLSGEAYKLGSDTPHGRLNRLFLRQVFGLGGPSHAVDAGANQLAGSSPIDNLTVTIGKFSVVDIFDTNAYAHDPRGDFLNWSVIDAGAFDYAGDAWGFTYGAALEWTQSWWTLRGGYFDLSQTPGATELDNFRQHEWVGELETRGQFLGHPGKYKFLGFLNRGDMGSYADAINLTPPDTSQVRHFASRTGYSVNVEQELASDLGFFFRASWNDGNQEAFDFTDINRSIAAGLSLKGNYWHQPNDTLGVSLVVNGISSAAQAYFANGGTGLLVGDGKLPHYGQEKIAEMYYSWHPEKYLMISCDYQYVENPAYNPDRGPVSVFGLRFHLEY